MRDSRKRSEVARYKVPEMGPVKKPSEYHGVLFYYVVSAAQFPNDK